MRKEFKKIFVASSKTNRSLAEKVIGILEDINEDCEYEIQVIPWWNYDVFVTGKITLNEVLRAVTECDAGIFVLGIEDCVEGTIKKKDELTEKDHKAKETISKQEICISSGNVLIEAGMFYGMKNSATVCLYTDEGVPIPSDLSGITRIIHNKEKEYKTKEQLKEWIKELKKHEGKYLLANNHGIENVPPVFVTNKSHIERTLTLQMREQYAKEIRLLNYAGSSFLSGSDIAERYDTEWKKWFKDALKGKTKFTIILTDPDSFAAKDAAKYKMYPQGGLKVDLDNIIPDNIQKLYDLKVKHPNLKLFSYLTDIALPYALFETVFDDPKENHIKVDLYSPLTFDDEKRPSFMVYRKENEALYDHFSSVIDHIILNENTKQLKTNNLVNIQNNFLLEKNVIDDALQKEYRQYFVGKLARPQMLGCLEQGDLEIGTSLYKKPKADIPHMHSKTSEILYILKGTYKVLDINANKKYVLNEGDFFALAPKTPYASKANADTQVLFIKNGGNDKVPVEVTFEVQKWLEQLG